jgi:molecular chaperone GrpE (heat shock protein)
MKGADGVEGAQDDIDAVGGAQPVAEAESMPEPSEEPAPDEPSLAATLAELAGQIRANNARAEARERVIDWLRGEVEQLKRGEHDVLLRPVVTDLQNLRSDLLQQARTLRADIDHKQMVGLLESFAFSVEQALERCGSLPIRPSVGDGFSAREHRAVKLLPASSANEDETIAEVIADGYLDAHNDRVAVPARVHVLRWTGTPPAQVSEAVDERIDEQEGTNA